MGIDVRTGIGLDVHAFGGVGPVRLGGIDVPHESGLVGHSDADVVAHSVTDALLGAAGKGDIGMAFPDTDPLFAGADSLVLLGGVVADVVAAGWTISNVDVTLVGERPTLAPYREAIRSRLADILGVACDRVNVKATTTEHLGFLGRSEGLACEAIATLIRSG